MDPPDELVALGGESGSARVGNQSTTVSRRDTLSVTLTVDGRAVTLTPKIADFGLAKQLVGNTHLTETGRLFFQEDERRR